MLRKGVSGIMLTILLLSTFSILVSIQQAEAQTNASIWIWPDGSIYPQTAPILRSGDIYTLTCDITTNVSGIMIERSGIVIDGAGHTIQGNKIGLYKGLYLLSVHNVTIKNLNIKRFRDSGIFLNSAYYSDISANNVSESDYGISLMYSSNNSLSKNSIANNREGIVLGYSPNNTLSNNNMANNTLGVWTLYSSNGIFLNNTFLNDGMLVSESYDNVVEGNLVNGKPLVYLDGVSDRTVHDAGQVILINCNRIVVRNLNLSNASVGVQLRKTKCSTIADNIIASNYWGINLAYSSHNILSANSITGNYDDGSMGFGLVHSSSYNTLVGNNVAGNNYAAYIYQSSQNDIYHNNFADNPEQVSTDASVNAWDDGYPSGGNYWSDYTGVDANGDEIGDTSYVVDANNQDRYPLMNPWTPTPLWPMFQHDPQRTGRNTIEGPGISDNPSVSALLNVTAGDCFSPPIIDSQGNLYMGARINGKYGLYAFSSVGIQKWFCVNATPLILTREGNVFCYIIERNARTMLELLNPSGHLLWEKSLEGQFPATNSIMENNGVIYMLTNPFNGNSQELMAIDKETGNIFWTYEPGESPNIPAIGQNGVIYFGCGDTLFAINPNGTEKWQRSFPMLLLNGSLIFGCARVDSPLVRSDGTIVVLVHGEKQTSYHPAIRLHAIDPEDPNIERWVTDYNPLFLNAKLAIGKNDDTIITGFYDPGMAAHTGMFCFDREGKLSWSITVGAGGSAHYPSSEVVDSAGRIYALFQDGVGSYSNIQAFDENGTRIWSIDAPRGRMGWLSLGANWTLYSGGQTCLFAITGAPLTPPPDFSMTADPASLTIEHGSSGTSTITVTSLNDFDKLVFLEVSGAPSGVSTSLDNFVAPGAGGTATPTLTISVGNMEIPESNTLTVTGTSDTLTHSIDVSLEIVPRANQPPYQPSSLSQRKSDGATIAEGEIIQESTVVFKGTVSDPEGHSVKLEIELRRIDESFTGVPTPETVSEFVASGSEVTITRTGLWNGGYHWQYRATDAEGSSSQWTEFGDTGNADFSISVGTDPFIAYLNRYSGAPGIPLTISGTNLGSKEDTKVCFGTTPDDFWPIRVEPALANEAQIVVLVPEGRGQVYVWVEVLVNPYTSKKSNTVKFSYEMPVIDGFSPSSGSPEWSVTISGRNFGFRPSEADSHTWVKFGRSFAEIVSWEDTRIVVKAPADLGTGATDIWHLVGLIQKAAGGDVGKLVYGIQLMFDIPSPDDFFIPEVCKMFLSPDGEGVGIGVRVGTYVGMSESRWWTYEFYENINGGGAWCPVEFRVYNSQGQVSGIVNGVVKTEIPYSHCFGNSVIIFCANDSYRYEIAGQNTGDYNFTAFSITQECRLDFSAMGIPIIAGAAHEYSIFWDVLSRGQEGVTVQVDSSGDGIFEHTFASDGELTKTEYITVMSDINGDKRIDIRDIAQASLAFGSYPDHPRWNVAADINQDGVVDIRDLVIVAKNFGKTYV